MITCHSFLLPANTLHPKSIKSLRNYSECAFPRTLDPDLKLTLRSTSMHLDCTGQLVLSAAISSDRKQISSRNKSSLKCIVFKVSLASADSFLKSKIDKSGMYQVKNKIRIQKARQQQLSSVLLPFSKGALSQLSVLFTQTLIMIIAHLSAFEMGVVLFTTLHNFISVHIYIT